MQLLQQRALITLQGKQELMAEIACLRQIRQDILDDPQSCGDGDAGAIHNELSAVEKQILRLREVLTSATLVDDSALVVAIGSQVTLLGEQGRETFTISGPLAANPYFGNISYESPLGQALLGRELGDEVEWVSAKGQRRLRIVDVRPVGGGGSGSLRRTA